MAPKFERMMEFTPVWANDFTFQKQNNLFSDDDSKQNSGGIWIWNRFTQKNEERLKTKENLSKERKNLSKWILFYFC